MQETVTNVCADLEQAVTEMLHKARIPAHIKGFYYLRTAISLAVNDSETISAITKELYPEVGKMYQTTASRVERAIRHAIETGWNRGAYENLSYMLNYEIGSEERKPANSEFIAAIADYLRLKLKKAR